MDDNKIAIYKTCIEAILNLENGSTKLRDMIDTNIIYNECPDEEYIEAMNDIPAEMYAPYSKEELVQKVEHLREKLAPDEDKDDWHLIVLIIVSLVLTFLIGLIMGFII